MPATLPHLDADLAARTVSRLLPAGPDLSRGEIDEVVAGLRTAAEASVDPVADVTGLGAEGATGPMLVVDRPTWARANVDMAVTLLEEASGEPVPTASALGARVVERANSVQLGGVFALLGARILGQYLPFAARPSLLLVAPNVAKVERDLDVDRGDFRLWICLHEQTHRLQFARAPWLRAHLLSEVAVMLADEPHGRRTGRPRSILDAVTTPEQQAVLERVTATMALLEGYADDMMDRVGPEVVPTVRTIRDRFEKRRNRTGLAQRVNRVLGMDLKLAQYREGARFCRDVIGRVGVQGLNAVYAEPAHLPTPREIAEPARWVARVHG